MIVIKTASVLNSSKAYQKKYVFPITQPFYWQNLTDFSNFIEVVILWKNLSALYRKHTHFLAINQEAFKFVCTFVPQVQWRSGWRGDRADHRGGHAALEGGHTRQTRRHPHVVLCQPARRGTRELSTAFIYLSTCATVLYLTFLMVHDEEYPSNLSRKK